MKNIVAFFLSIVLFAFSAKAQIYTGKTSEVSFFSDGPMEDIYAICKSGQILFNAVKNEVAVRVTIKAFEFDSKLMQEHFNEKYMESDKFPYATFTGKLSKTIDLTKDGIYKVDVVGKLTMHGVEKERTVPATVTVKSGDISVESKFIIALKDHHVEVPKLIAQNIAETVEATVKMTLVPFKK
jgi:polyisoprenoid-binding protein YceI